MNSGIAKTIIRFKRAAAVVAVAAVSLFIVAAGNATPKTSGKGKNANPVAPKTKDRFIDQESKSDPAMRSFTIVKKNETFIQNPTNEKIVQSVKNLTGQALREKQALTASEIKRWEKNTAALKKNKMLARSKSKNYKKRAKKLSIEIKQASARGENTTRLKAEQAHLEHKAAQEGRGTKKATKDLKTENARHDAAMNGKPSAGQRALDHVGFAGIALSLVDAAKNAYYETTDEHGNKVVKFSFQKYLVNAFQNVTGIAAAKDLFTGTIDTGAKEYDRLMAEYKKKGITPTNGEWAEILAKSFLRAAAFGAYNGAKCVPVLGDLLNGLELGAAAGEWYHDTKESERIQAENAVELERQRKMGMVKIKALMKDYKACGTRVENIQKRSEEILADFKTQHRQYIEVFARMVKRGETAEKGDALAEAAKKAKPFLLPKYLEKLASDVKVVGHATDVTVKLADTTIDNIQNHGGSPESAAGTAAELKKMVETLKSYDQECAAAVDALSPLMGGGGTIDKQAEAAEAAATDSMVASDIYATAADLVAEHKALLAEERRLRATQKKIMDTARKLTTYYYIGGDETTKTDIAIALRNAMQYKIDDYPAKKLAEHQNTLNFGFRDFRGDIPVPEGLPPEVADAVALAADTLPGVAGIRGTLKAKIAAAEAALGRLGNIGKNVVEQRGDFKEPSLEERKFLTMSTGQIWDHLSLTRQGSASMGLVPEHALRGYKVYKDGTEIHEKLVSSDSDICARVVETGTARVSLDDSLVDDKYTIWYVLKVSGFGELDEYSSSDWEKDKKECEHEMQTVTEVHLKNADRAVIGRPTSYPTCYAVMGGKAWKGGFRAEVRVLTVCTFEKHWLRLYSDKTQTGSSDDFWKQVRDGGELDAKMKRWESLMGGEVESYMNDLLAIPSKFMAFSEREFYLDARKLPLPNLQGLLRQKKKDAKYYKSGAVYTRTFQVTENKKGKLTISLDYRVYYPRRSVSWNEFIEKKMPEYLNYIGKKGRKSITVAGADKAVARIERRSHSKWDPPVHSINAVIVFVTRNLRVSVRVQGYNMPMGENVDPIEIANQAMSIIGK